MTKRFLSFVAGVFTALLMLTISSVVYAQDGDAASAQTGLSQLSKMAFEILTPIVIIFATWGAHRLLKVFETKTGFDIPDKQETKIDEWIELGIHWAEEKSRNKLRETTERLEGGEKLEGAADFVLGFVKAKGWDDWTRDQIKSKIEGKLGIHRANGGKPSLDKGDK